MVQQRHRRQITLWGPCLEVPWGRTSTMPHYYGEPQESKNGLLVSLLVRFYWACICRLHLCFTNLFISKILLIQFTLAVAWPGFMVMWGWDKKVYDILAGVLVSCEYGGAALGSLHLLAIYKVLQLLQLCIRAWRDKRSEMTYLVDPWWVKSHTGICLSV